MSSRPLYDSNHGVRSARFVAIENTAADWLSRSEAGLSADEQLEFNGWMLADARHAEAVTRLKSAWERLQQPRHSDQVSEVMRAIEINVARRARRSRRRWAFASIAVPLAAAAAAWIVTLSPTRPLALPVEPAVAVVTVKPERRHLADGSVVELNSGAEIAIEFSSAKRAVRLLRGEAHFDVAKEVRPFVVMAGSVAVRAVGTEFAVRLAEDVDVLVTEGRVAVEHLPDTVPVSGAADVSETDESALAEPASRLTYVDAGNRVSVPAMAATTVLPQPRPITPRETEAVLAWRGNRVEFINAPLAEVVAHFNRRNRVKISLGDHDIAMIRISGVFWVDDPAALARLVQASADLHADYRNPDEIILER